jgi:hypothetical protein
LPPTKTSNLWDKVDPLVEAADLNAKPALVRAAHVGADQPSGNANTNASKFSLG